MRANRAKPGQSDPKPRTPRESGGGPLFAFMPPGWAFDRPASLAPISLLMLFGATASIAEPGRANRNAKPDKAARFWEFRPYTKSPR